MEDVEEFIHSQSETVLRHVATTHPYGTSSTGSADAVSLAEAMLQRLQAQAVVCAREQIVDGAVSTVRTALDQLEERDIVDLDPERRAAMVSNLLVVLCSDSPTQPVVNTGGLYS